MNRLRVLLCGLALAAAGCGHAVQSLQETWPVGYVDRKLFDEPRYEAFRAGIDTTKVDGQLAAFIGEARGDASVLVVFGAWCADSKRGVPRFLSVADAAHFPASSVRFYSLDRTKESPDGLTEQFGIQRVPTFIFMRGGGEIGRIVESPKTTLEQDMLAILAPRYD